MTILLMAKWIWLGLFLMTALGLYWLGQGGSNQALNPAPMPASGMNNEDTKNKNTLEVPAEMVRPDGTPIPMSPNLIRAPEPSPYSDPEGRLKNLENMPPPVYEGGNDPSGEGGVSPPPSQTYTEPGGGAPGFPPGMDSPGVFPDYLKPEPGLENPENELIETPPSMDEDY